MILNYIFIFQKKMTRIMSVRLAHSRFFKGKSVSRSEKFDKVVTTLWSFQPDKSILTYASSVFTKKSKNDFWVKKEQRKNVQERFENNPIRVHIIRDDFGPEMSSTPVDWFISSYLIFQYGTHNKISPDVRRVHHEITVKNDFNEHYDPFYRPDRYIVNGKRNITEVTPSKWLYFLYGFLAYPLVSEYLGQKGINI